MCLFIIISFYNLAQVKKRFILVKRGQLGEYIWWKYIMYIHKKCLNKTCKIKLAYTNENTEFISSASP